MSLRGAISSLDTAVRFIDRPMPSEARLARAVAGLTDRVDASDGGGVEDPEAFVARLIEHWARERSYAGLSRRELRAAARHLFTQSKEGPRLVDDEARVGALLAHPHAASSVYTMKNFATAFVAGFDPSLPGALDRITRHINGSAPEKRLESVSVWAEAGLIDRTRGPKKLAAQIMSGGTPVEAAFDALRLPELLRASGVVRAAFHHTCEFVRENAAKSPVLINILIDWASQSGDMGEGRVRLRYPDLVGETVNALLLPWIGGAPGQETERRVRNFVIDAIKDPRFAGSSAQWADVDEAARRVLTGWLTRASVLQFFEIVSQTMTTPDEKRMWRYRRKFWSAYLPHIADAWVCFGAQGEQLARETARRTEDNSFKQFGRLNGAVASTHAVLVMTIGDLVIAEWSHNGKCRMWRRGDHLAPKLYASEYHAGKLRNSEWWEMSHTGNETYGWQGKFAEKIRRETGVSMRQIDYRV